MSNEYTFPDTEALKGEASRGAIANLVYECSTCSVKCNSAATLKLHVEGKKHIKKTTEAGHSEDPSVADKIKEFEGLEEPHRATHKEDKANKFKELLAKKKEENEGKTKEELKAEGKERKELKRKREEAGEIKPSKKAKVAVKANYTCGVCDCELTGQAPFIAHMQGAKHMRKVAAWEGGCWLCAVPAPASDAHFNGKAHKNALARLAEMGVDPNSVGETGWVELAGQGKKSNGGAFAMMGGAAPKMAKGKGGGKGKKQKMAMMGAADDMTCWDFKKGTCKRGDECKWEH